VGCGCGKNSNNRRARAAAARKKALADRLTVASQDLKDKINKRRMIMKRINFCRPCPHSIQTKTERRAKTRICHKCETSVQSIVNNSTFKCPIGNF